MKSTENLKISKYRKQFIVSSILPKKEQNSLSWASFLLRIVQWFSFLFWENWKKNIICFRDCLTFIQTVNTDIFLVDNMRMGGKQKFAFEI